MRNDKEAQQLKETRRIQKAKSGGIEIVGNRFRCWISFLPCEGRMGTQTTVSQGITTIICCLSGVKTSGQADCLSISSFYCGRVALAVCWLLSFMVLPIHHTSFAWNAGIWKRRRPNNPNIEAKGRDPLTREGEPLSAWDFVLVPLFNCFKPRFVQ